MHCSPSFSSRLGSSSLLFLIVSGVSYLGSTRVRRGVFAHSGRDSELGSSLSDFVSLVRFEWRISIVEARLV